MVDNVQIIDFIVILHVRLIRVLLKINQSRYNNIIILANVIYHHFLSNVT